MNTFKWNLINNANILPESGIYAWYYGLSVGDYDINQLINNLHSSEDDRMKNDFVQSFLEKNFFNFFKEDNYVANLSGKLMPSFKGELIHLDQCSSGLVDKILAEPEVLWDLKDIIQNISIEFSSPIYIGMSDNLQKRINNHKKLIEKFKTERVSSNLFEDRDENFAARVISRGMIETNLFVSINYITSKNNIHNMMENLLNRVSYPILGRN